MRYGIIAAVLLVALPVQAVQFVQKDNFLSGQHEIIHEELWIAADAIAIDGTAENDLFAAGSSLDLRGTFAGDVWGIAETVTASGTFSDDVRLGAKILQFSGCTKGALLTTGNTVKIEPTAQIGKSLFAIGENIISEGVVSGPVHIIAQKVTLGGQLKNDIMIMAQDIVILPGTRIEGTLTYTAPKEMVLSDAIYVGGGLVRKFDSKETPPKQIFKALPGVHFTYGLAAVITGMVFFGLFPRYAGRAAGQLKSRFWLCLLLGTAALVLGPVTAVFLMITVLGLPLGLIALLAYLILLYLGKVAVALALGALILRRPAPLPKKGIFFVLFIGMAILYLLTGFVAISLVAGLLIAAAGMGALLMAAFTRNSPYITVSESS